MVAPRYNPVLCWHQSLKLQRKAKLAGDARRMAKARKIKGIALAVSLWD